MNIVLPWGVSYTNSYFSIVWQPMFHMYINFCKLPTSRNRSENVRYNRALVEENFMKYITQKWFCSELLLSQICLHLMQTLWAWNVLIIFCSLKSVSSGYYMCCHVFMMNVACGRWSAPPYKSLSHWDTSDVQCSGLATKNTSLLHVILFHLQHVCHRHT